MCAAGLTAAAVLIPGTWATAVGVLGGACAVGAGSGWIVRSGADFPRAAAGSPQPDPGTAVYLVAPFLAGAAMISYGVAVLRSGRLLRDLPVTGRVAAPGLGGLAAIATGVAIAQPLSPAVAHEMYPGGSLDRINDTLVLTGFGPCAGAAGLRLYRAAGPAENAGVIVPLILGGPALVAVGVAQLCGVGPAAPVRGPPAGAGPTGLP